MNEILLNQYLVKNSIFFIQEADTIILEKERILRAETGLDMIVDRLIDFPMFMNVHHV